LQHGAALPWRARLHLACTHFLYRKTTPLKHGQAQKMAFFASRYHNARTSLTLTHLDVACGRRDAQEPGRAATTGCLFVPFQRRLNIFAASYACLLHTTPQTLSHPHLLYLMDGIRIELSPTGDVIRTVSGGAW